MFDLRHMLLGLGFVVAGMQPANSIKPTKPMPDFPAKWVSHFAEPRQITTPDNNPFQEAKYELGKKLFFDPRLSKSGVMACASCHHPSFSWSDGLRRAVGHGHKTLARRTPTLFNVAWGKSYFWDGRAPTLEHQALMPITSKDEMNLTKEELEKRIEATPEYRETFERIFPKDGVNAINIGKALATFERSIIGGESAFDRWRKGDNQAVSESAKRGFSVFTGKGQCVNCHSGWNFTNGSFADTGTTRSDIGRAQADPSPYLKFAFKTPTLRDVARRAPYMHDGAIDTLEEVIEHYERGGSYRRKNTALFLSPIELQSVEKADLVEFLKSLNEDPKEFRLPTLPAREGT